LGSAERGESPDLTTNLHFFAAKLGHMLMGVSSSMMAQRGMGDYGAETTDREYNYQAHLGKISQVTLLPAAPLGQKGADRNACCHRPTW
jgi:hypothetical protein